MHELAALHDILDASVVAHVGVVTDGQPFVMPVGYARDGDRLLLHGSTGSRLFRALGSGDPACVTVTLLDGLVAARSLFESSMHYRCAVVLGHGQAVRGKDKAAALDLLGGALLPGRLVDARPPTRRELAATSVVAMPLDEWSVKVSNKPPAVVDEDAGWAPWTGVVPLRIAAGQPVTHEGSAVPDYVATWQR